MRAPILSPASSTARAAPRASWISSVSTTLSCSSDAARARAHASFGSGRPSAAWTRCRIAARVSLPVSSRRQACSAAASSACSSKENIALTPFGTLTDQPCGFLRCVDVGLGVFKLAGCAAVHLAAGCPLGEDGFGLAHQQTEVMQAAQVELVVDGYEVGGNVGRFLCAKPRDQLAYLRIDLGVADWLDAVAVEVSGGIGLPGSCVRLLLLGLCLGRPLLWLKRLDVRLRRRSGSELQGLFFRNRRIRNQRIRREGIRNQRIRGFSIVNGR